MRTFDVYRCNSLNIATPVEAYLGAVRVSGQLKDVHRAVQDNFGVAYIYETRMRLQEDDYKYSRSNAGLWVAETDILWPFRAERSTKRLAEAAAKQHRDCVRKARALPSIAYECGAAERFKFM